jgi:hypothetical protein
MLNVRLLGGSHHGKKTYFPNPPRQIYMHKKQKKIQWSPGDIHDTDTFYVPEMEVYEYEKMRQVIPKGSKLLITIKGAWVKKGSKVKPETFWKLALDVETYEEWQFATAQ